VRESARAERASTTAQRYVLGRTRIDECVKFRHGQAQCTSYLQCPTHLLHRLIAFRAFTAFGAELAPRRPVASIHTVA